MPEINDDDIAGGGTTLGEVKRRQADLRARKEQLETALRKVAADVMLDCESCAIGLESGQGSVPFIISTLRAARHRLNEALTPLQEII